MENEGDEIVRRWVFLGVLGAIVLVSVWYIVISFPRPLLEKDFTLRDVYNRPLRLSRFAGRPIILCFFSPRCGDCKEEIPQLNELYVSHRKDGLVVVGVGVKYPEEIREFVREQKIAYPVVIDADLAVSKEFGVFFLPHLVFMNRQGKIVASIAGKTPPEELKKHLEGIL